MKTTAFLHLVSLLLLATNSANAVEIAQLAPENWDELAPAGKEVDCIYGDFVLRNDNLIVVIAEPNPTRNANMTVRNNGAMIIDLTRRNTPNDQLSVYHPNGMQASFHSPDRVAIKIDGKVVSVKGLIVRGSTVEWQCSTTAPSGLDVTVRYTLADGADVLQAETIIHNPTAEKIEFIASDYIRADRTFEFGSDPATGLFWAHDDWFAQAYGVVVEGCTLKRGGSRGAVLEIERAGDAKVSLAAKESTTISRAIFPGASLLEVRAIADRLAGIASRSSKFRVIDGAGPVVHARLTVSFADQEFGSARTDANGEVVISTPEAVDEFNYVIEASGGRRVEGTHGVAPDELFVYELPQLGNVVGDITDESGEPIPCKVAFHGLDGTPTPDFGPDSGAVAVKNLHYSHNGEFRQPIAPGKYEAIISFGPEFDAVFKTIDVARGETTKLSAKLKRVVDTTGWVSSDFHSHSTPSGDNTSMQLGRVLNLLCENVEFCPCTEHNRISSYLPHLKQLGVEHLMATCSGLELTGSLLPVNHQNAFPLKYTPRTQDGGAPVTDTNPVTQIERLAFWDDKSDKLVQENHPNLFQIIGDKDLNGEPDGGFAAMLGFMDVIEVHPPEAIFTKPEKDDKGRLSRNPIYHWMQMLNLGYRIPGVVNTDAHYNFHESGWLRNYLKSPTDDPGKIETMDVVHTSEAGHIVMTTGPFMEVVLTPKKRSITPTGIPGDDVIAPGGTATLSVRVQCSNWLDINRVQVFVNGRSPDGLNFTRRETPQPFGDGVIKFEADIPLELVEDSHIIVAALGEGLQLGRVMGPVWGEKPPVAVSNPIFVDIDSDGFKPNGDLLDVSLPLTER